MSRFDTTTRPLAVYQSAPKSPHNKGEIDAIMSDANKLPIAFNSRYSDESSDRLETEAVAAFEAGDFETSQSAYLRLFESGAARPDHIEILATLFLEAGDPLAAIDAIDRFLDQQAGEIDVRDNTMLARMRFEAARQIGDPEIQLSAAHEWLEAMIGEGGDAPVLDPDSRAILEGVFIESLDRLDWFEYLAQAPRESGLPVQALALIEAFGMSHGNDPGVARKAERLLHALGASEAAYRVEHNRRTLSPKPKSAQSKADKEDKLNIAGWIIAIAGGHPAMRKLIETDLMRAGAKEIREIPPRWEGSRSGRDINQLLSGADVAVLIGRQISHSTVDQIKRGATISGVPVITSLTASTSGLRRALAFHLESTRLDKSKEPT
jgi:hypothetical protein